MIPPSRLLLFGFVAHLIAIAAVSAVAWAEASS
jgi:hypothetical protein